MSLYSTIYGNQLIENELFEATKGARILIAVNQDVWEQHGLSLKFKGFNLSSVYYVHTMERAIIEKDFAALPEFDVAVGVGGGMAMDMAKYFAWKNNVDVYQVPTAISVDAMYSYPIAIRENGKVIYDGECFAKEIYVDYDILQAAPKLFNRSGACDILSCHTALFDWTLDPGSSVLDRPVYDKAASMLSNYINHLDDVYNVTENGINLTMQGFQWVAEESYRLGHCRYEEGSEHFFYYALEAQTQKHYLHGKVVNLGIYLMSLLQSNQVDTITDVLKRIGVPINPESMGITYQDIRVALEYANQYAKMKDYSYSILNHQQIDHEFIDFALDNLKRQFG